MAGLADIRISLSTIALQRSLEDLLDLLPLSRPHCAAAPFFSSAGQLTITVSGCGGASEPVSTRNRLPSAATSYGPIMVPCAGNVNNASGAEGSIEPPFSF